MAEILRSGTAAFRYTLLGSAASTAGVDERLLGDDGARISAGRALVVRVVPACLVAARFGHSGVMTTALPSIVAVNPAASRTNAKRSAAGAS